MSGGAKSKHLEHAPSNTDICHAPPPAILIGIWSKVDRRPNVAQGGHRRWARKAICKVL
jgi:hypothetical protein